MSDTKTRAEKKLSVIKRESDDGVLWVDTGFGSSMQIARPNAKFLKELKTTQAGARAYSIIQSYLYLIQECDPNILGCDPDEDVRRIKALRAALKTKRTKPTQKPPAAMTFCDNPAVT